jgi:hypothetical protein
MFRLSEGTRSPNEAMIACLGITFTSERTGTRFSSLDGDHDFYNVEKTRVAACQDFVSNLRTFIRTVS